MMRRLFTPLFMAWGMFSAIPCPCRLWDESRRGAMLFWLPALGLLHGLIWYLAALALRALLGGGLLMAAVLCLLPWLTSGGIHLDGYMDCCDAIFSRRDLEGRRRILKDSHVGAFAVIGMVGLGILQFASLAEIRPEQNLLPLLLIPAAVRACSVLAICFVPALPTSGYAGESRSAQGLRSGAAVLLMLAVAVLLPIFLCGMAGISVLIAGLGSGLTLFWCARDLRGMSGDISGCGITVGELCGVLALALLPVCG